MQRKMWTLVHGVGGLAATVLSGCVVAPVGRPVYTSGPGVVYPAQVPAPGQGPVPGGVIGQPAPVVVYQNPPPPPPEMIGVAPAPGLFWIGGFWAWDGGRHVWRPGRWERHRHGQAYVPHQWVRAGNGWQLHGGHWR